MVKLAIGALAAAIALHQISGLVVTCQNGTCTASFNSSEIATRGIIQSGACSTLFASTTGNNAGTSAYTVSGAPQCQAYSDLSAGTAFLFVPDVANGPAASLTIDGHGPYTLMAEDGQTELAVQALQPGYGYPMWFDGSVVRMQAQ